jgi:hypothetical protein
MPWDMAFSERWTKYLISGYPSILYHEIQSTLLGEILEGPGPKNVLIKDGERPKQYVEIIMEQFRVLIFVVGQSDHAKGSRWPTLDFYTRLQINVHNDSLKYIDEHRPDELYVVLIVGGTARIINYRQPLLECSTDQSGMLSKLKAYLETNPSKATEVHQRFAISNQPNLNGTSKANYVDGRNAMLNPVAGMPCSEGLGFTAAAAAATKVEEEKP